MDKYILVIMQWIYICICMYCNYVMDKYILFIML